MVKKLFSKRKEDIVFPLLIVVILLLLFILTIGVLDSISVRSAEKAKKRASSFSNLSSESGLFSKNMLEHANQWKTVILADSSVTRKDTNSWLIHEEANRYSIEYVVEQDAFVVTIHGQPYDIHKAEAEAWFLGKGLTAQDLCILPVVFGATYLATEDMADISFLFPTGCLAAESY